MALDIISGHPKKQKVGEFDHLNESDPLFGDIIDLERLVDRAVAANYGGHRLLSAFVRARERSPRYERQDRVDHLTEGLKELLVRHS